MDRDVKNVCGMGSSQVAELNEKQRRKLSEIVPLWKNSSAYVLYYTLSVRYFVPRTSAPLEARVKYIKDEMRIRLRNLNEI